MSGYIVVGDSSDSLTIFSLVYASAVFYVK